MTIAQMLSQSLILTLLGLSVVFSFLVVLIVFVSLTAKVIKANKKSNHNIRRAIFIPYSVCVFLIFIAKSV